MRLVALVLSATTLVTPVTLTDDVRSFNRFYTREIGLLNRSLPATDLSLPEARVSTNWPTRPKGGRTAAEIGRMLKMDKAHLSRVVARSLAPAGWRRAGISPEHRKHRLLTLSEPRGARRSPRPRPPPGRKSTACFSPSTLAVAKGLSTRCATSARRCGIARPRTEEPGTLRIWANRPRSVLDKVGRARAKLPARIKRRLYSFSSNRPLSALPAPKQPHNRDPRKPSSSMAHVEGLWGQPSAPGWGNSATWGPDRIDQALKSARRHLATRCGIDGRPPGRRNWRRRPRRPDQATCAMTTAGGGDGAFPGRRLAPLCN